MEMEFDRVKTTVARPVRPDLFQFTVGSKLTQEEARVVFLHLSQNVAAFHRSNRALSDNGFRKLIQDSLVVITLISLKY